MTFTALISAGFHISASVIAMAVLSVWGCTPMKTLDTEVYRPVDYLEAEREAMVSELNATLDEHLDEIHLSLETLELKNASQKAAIKRLTAQYSTLQKQYNILHEQYSSLQSSRLSHTPADTTNNKSLDMSLADNSFQINKSVEPQKEIAVKSKAAAKKRTTEPHSVVQHHAEANDSSPKETTSSMASKNAQAASSMVPAEAPLSSGGVSLEDVNRIYTKARALLLENNPEKAEPLFEILYQNHPKHPLAVNALYWAGECRYSLHDYQGAITLFKRLMEAYPTGIKVPDAMLKTAYAYLSMDDPDRAHHYLKSVVKIYPFSPAGEKAAEKLKAYQ